MKYAIILPLLMLAAGPAYGQGWIEPPPRQLRDFGVVKLRTAVSVRIAGRIAHVAVEEWFVNRGRRLGEGDYLYPLPGEAVFGAFSLFQGDVELRGETMDAQQARAIYEEIVRRKRDPALIELAGHGLIRARVFPINPGETRKITLRYTQILERAGDALQFRYAAGGRTGMRAHVEGSSAQQPVREPTPITFELTIDDAAAFRDPFSPTHEVEVRRRNGRLVVRPEQSLTGDLVLFLPFARDAVGLTIVTHRPEAEDGYFMLTLSPGQADGAVVPRDITVVVDVSGSMSGSKLAQARAALRQLLGTLRPADRFRLISFSNTVRSYHRGWTGATQSAVRDAERWVDGLRANGGTDIAGALEAAFRLQSPDERLPIVLFLTDGLPSVGERNPERIADQAERARGRARVFAFGVGYDVNTYLLDRLSAAGRGATEYVGPHEDVEQALGTLVTKIQHPVLTDLGLEGPVRFAEVYPGRLPDLFASEELVIFGRYRGSRTGSVSVSGRRNARAERFTTRARFAEHQDANDFIPRLWAARKIGVLQQAVRLNGPNPELIEEIRETALRYGLLSEYTSYLVQEPEQVAGIRPGQAPVANMAATLQAAPKEQQGAGAVAVARSDRARREVRSMFELDAVDERLLGRGHFPQAQHVAGRVFVERDSVWTDLTHGDSLEVVTIEAFSPAYFTLLRRLPELKPVFARFARVLIAGHGVSIEIGPTGITDAGQIDRLARRFRTP